MAERIRKVNPILWFACSFLIWMVAFSSAAAKARPGPAQEPAAPAVAAPAQQQQQEEPPLYDAEGYVGEEACVECHDEQKTGYYQSTHNRAVDPRTPAAEKACETCHGPTGQHADDPVIYPIKNDFTKMSPDDVADVCTTCHNRGEHALWDGSQHAARGVTCTSCHSNHAPKSDEGQLKLASQTEVCGSCHRDKAQKMNRPGHMPVREGKLECMTCHNAHGSPNVRLLRVGTSVNEACTSCHAEKRGPFLWEHAPVAENCSTCHDPHGSNNDRLLVAKAPMLCQRCHVHSRHPATIYDNVSVTNNVNRIVSRACVNCHSNIHGSNHPSGATFAR